jgi:hypothetical protein
MLESARSFYKPSSIYTSADVKRRGSSRTFYMKRNKLHMLESARRFYKPGNLYTSASVKRRGRGVHLEPSI